MFHVSLYSYLYESFSICLPCTEKYSDLHKYTLWNGENIYERFLFYLLSIEKHKNQR